MSEIIVDTSAFIAFFVRSEKHHPAARRYAAQRPTVRWIILETVFDEFVTWMRAKVSILDSIQVGRVLREEPSVRKHLTPTTQLLGKSFANTMTRNRVTQTVLFW